MMHAKVTDLVEHPLSSIVPNMRTEEWVTFLDDITDRGILEPLVVLENNTVIDGRHRMRAALQLGLANVPVRIVHLDEGEAEEYMVKAAILRRHLTDDQRVVLGREWQKRRSQQVQSDAGKYAVGIRDGVIDLGTMSKSITPHDTRKEAADMFGVSSHKLRDIKQLENKAPEMLEDVRSGKKSIPEAKAALKKRDREQEREILAASARQIEPDERWSVEVGDIQTFQTDQQFDFIITDPPYPREFLPLYEVLAERCLEWLKPSGLLVAMCGQSYLDEIYTMLSQHLTYYWTACYLTPGQPTPLRTRQVNTTWKPILIFAKDAKYTGKIFGDVFKSDGNDKEHHKWGQSESGMLSLVSQICLPGQTIFDPFCGAGTTGLAALRHGCLFTGIDIDEQNVLISRGRLQKA